MKRVLITFIIFLISTLFLSACGSPSNGDESAIAVESYLNALVNKDGTALSTLSCKDWEPTALLELDSFQGVTAKVDNPACAETGKDGDAALVTCQGKIVATYNNEDQDLPLNARTYKVVQEGGEWSVCGYK